MELHDGIPAAHLAGGKNQIPDMLFTERDGLLLMTGPSHRKATSLSFAYMGSSYARAAAFMERFIIGCGVGTFKVIARLKNNN